MTQLERGVVVEDDASTPLDKRELETDIRSENKTKALCSSFGRMAASCLTLTLKRLLPPFKYLVAFTFSHV